METTPTTPAPRPESTTYTLTVVFTVDGRTVEQLHTGQGMQDEITSWLESLNAAVGRVSVTQAG